MRPLRRLLLAGALATCALAMPTACDPAHRADSDGGDPTDTDGTWDGDGMPPGDCDGGDCAGTCGDGIMDSGEACDDGDDDNTDACPSTCEVATCGDGHVWAGHESCDDENDVDDDGCTACVLDSCGDAVLDDGEECDLGAANGTHGSSCFTTCVSPAISLADPVIRPFTADGGRGLGVVQLQAADINDDGHVDVVADATSSLDTSVVFGLGDGRMWPPHARQSASSSVRDLALGDLNGDGRVDAVLALDNPDKIEIYLGNGTGFDAGTGVDLDSSASEAVTAVDVTDLNGDGNGDIVLGDASVSRVFVMIGDGAGGISETTPVSTAVGGGGGGGPSEIATADITGDGIVDIITVNSASDDVSVLAGLGGGAFAGAKVYPTRIGAGGDFPVALAIADVTGEGRLDVVTANRNSDDVTVLAADESGELGAPVRFLTLEDDRGTGPNDVAIGDVTGDGLPDLIAVNGSHDVSVLAKAGPGIAFEKARVWLTGDDVATGRNPIDVKITDANEDGALDIVVIASGSKDISILLGGDDGSFEAAKLYEAGVGYAGTAPVEGAIADINEDGHVDVIFATSNNLNAIAGLGDGSFASSQSLPIYIDGGTAIVDFNGDRRLDLLSPYNSVVVTYVHDAVAGDFARGFGTGSSGDSFTWVAGGDTNGDGRADAVALSTGNRIRPFFQDDAGGLSMLGDPVPLPTTGTQVVMVDVSGDGALDLLVPTPSRSEVQMSIGDGQGGFGGFTPISTEVSTSGQQPVFIHAVDVTADDVIDVLTANAGSNDVSLLVGQGAGAFDAPIIIPTVVGSDPANVSAVRAGDFNRDGILDVAAANEARSTVSIAVGFGGGAFAAPQVFDVGFEPAAMAVADFDDDGVDDVAVASDDGQLAVLLGRGSETAR